MDWRYLVTATRPRVYLLWAVLVPLGFVATHFYQQRGINVLWTLISVIGLGFMWRTMPLKVRQMRHIFASWLIPVALGMAVSGAVFYVDAPIAGELLAHLGAFWLGVMAVGYVWNGLVDPPSGWYWVAAILHAAASAACFMVEDLLPVQYLVAAIVSAWSMLNLWFFRSG